MAAEGESGIKKGRSKADLLAKGFSKADLARGRSNADLLARATSKADLARESSKADLARGSSKVELEEGSSKTQNDNGVSDEHLKSALAGKKDGQPSVKAKIGGQVKALKFAQDMAKKAYAKRDEEVVVEIIEENGEERSSKDSVTTGSKERTGSKEKLSLLDQMKKKQAEQDQKDEAEIMSVFSSLKNPTFIPAPLHVRGLCQAAKRACAKELEREAERLHAAEECLRQFREASGGRAFKSVFAGVIADNLADECLTDEERDNIEIAEKRIRYNVELLQHRRTRLANLDNKTFQQLPAQLIEAASQGDAEYIRLCAEASCPLDIFNERGVTPLIMATVNNKVSSAKLLLQCKADPAMQDINGASSAHYAMELRRFQILDAILEQCGRSKTYTAVYVKDMRGKSVLDYARLPGREEALRLLKLRLGGPLGLVWSVGQGVVHQAVDGLPEGTNKSKNALAKHIAKMAAKRAAAKMEEKLSNAKEKAREKLLGGWLFSYCSKATISNKKLAETIETQIQDVEEEGDFDIEGLEEFTNPWDEF